MSNLTFDQNLIRKHTPEPLEGHTVVVLERVGEAGEKFHSVLEPGGDPLRPGILAMMLGRPNVYFAFAVDASRDRSLEFEEPVEMAERAPPIHLRFTLWYRVEDPRLLVSARDQDPLERVRKKVAEVVTEEIAELSWAEVWHSFRPASERVVASTMDELRTFARDYGIAINSLKLKAGFDEGVAETDREIHEMYERGRLLSERMAVADELKSRRAELRRDSAVRDVEDSATAATRKLQDTILEKYEEFLRGGTSVDDLRSVYGSIHGAAGSALLGPGSSAGFTAAHPSAGEETRDAVPYRVWYATNRKPRTGGRMLGYGGQVDASLHTGYCDVHIPATHRTGELGSGVIRRFVTGVDDRLKLVDVVPLGTDEFWAQVRQCSAGFSPSRCNALVFIHGYRVSFKDAALRAAQLGFDLDVQGPVSFFSWPSGGRLMGYLKDGAAVDASEGRIAEFLVAFARQSGADRVDVIAHSMGNRLLLRALQRILAASEKTSGVRFGHMVLAAPDITRDLFIDVAEQYKKLSHRTTLYISDADLALRASYRLQGPRVGLAPPITCVKGIDTVHVANVDRTLLGHSTFAEARPVLNDMYALFTHDDPPGRRFGLIERRSGEHQYWEIRR